MTYKIYENLAWLNDLPIDQAESAFLECCGSQMWAQRMAHSRPFAMLENLLQTADKTWASLSSADHLEAFAGHKTVASKKTDENLDIEPADRPAGEQVGMDAVAKESRQDLAKVCSLYEEKSGFIFILCALGRSAGEMLAICRARLGNSVRTELMIAAEEQRRITEIRLSKLLER